MFDNILMARFAPGGKMLVSSPRLKYTFVIAGKLSDVTGSYCVPYVICGTMMTISAVFFYIEPCIRRQRHNALSADGATSVERTGEKEIQRQ